MTMSPVAVLRARHRRGGERLEPEPRRRVVGDAHGAHRCATKTHVVGPNRDRGGAEATAPE